MTIATFHARRGRLGEQRLDALARLFPAYGLVVGETPLELGGLFGRTGPVVLEIGSGMGEATVALAVANPGRDYLAVEVHTAGVANLLNQVEAHDLTNVRVARGDAVALLTAQLAPASLDSIHVFFPDPWPKARHHKRRLVQSGHVGLLRDRLVPGGTLHCATDSADYAEQMLATLSGDAELRNAYPGYAPRPDWRPVTGFERRALMLGHTVFDLSFRRISS